MALDLASLLALAATCAPQVAPQTLAAIVQVESARDPLAIGINGGGRRAVRVTTPEAAAAYAESLIGAGHSVDLGLAQINSRNLGWLGLTPRAAFDPCRNLAAGARVLEAAYQRAAPAPGQEQAGLRAALSYYNTGHATRGLRNGYVARVTAAAGAQASGSSRTQRRSTPFRAAPPPAPWDVFARARGGFVISPIVGATS
jgi:type IV secretion system protein VirB1